MEFKIERERIFPDPFKSQYIEGLATFYIDDKIVTAQEFANRILLFCKEDCFKYTQI